MTRLQAALLCSRCAGRAQTELIPSVHQQGGRQALPVLPNRVLGRAGQRHRAVGAGQEDCGRQGVPREGEGCWLCSALLGSARPGSAVTQRCPSAARPPSPLSGNIRGRSAISARFPSPALALGAGMCRRTVEVLCGQAGGKGAGGALPSPPSAVSQPPCALCIASPRLWGRWMCRKAPGWDSPSGLEWGVCVCLSGFSRSSV